MKLNLGKLSTWFQAIQWVNILTAGLGAFNAVTAAFPDLQVPRWALITQIAVAAVLPSLGGVAHKVAFGEAQVPEQRGQSQA